MNDQLNYVGLYIADADTPDSETSNRQPTRIFDGMDGVFIYLYGYI